MAYLWGFMVGFLMAIFPVMALHRLLSRRFLGIEYPYLRGALLGFMAWVVFGLAIYLDLRYEFIGFMKMETGGALIALFVHSHFGFITGGMAVMYFSETMDILKKRPTSGSKG